MVRIGEILGEVHVKRIPHKFCTQNSNTNSPLPYEL